MKLVVYLVLALVLANVECAVLHLAGASLVKVNAALVVVTYLAMRSMPFEGAIGAFFVGYFVDLLSGLPTGLDSFLALLVFLLARVAVAAVDVRGGFGFTLLAGVTSLAHKVLAWLMAAATTGSDELHSTASLSAAVSTAMLTMAVAPFMYLLLKGIESKLTREETGALA